MEDLPGAVYPFVADGGLQVVTAGSSDPYTDRDDLLAVVEILCPVWPMRATFLEMRYARL